MKPADLLLPNGALKLLRAADYDGIDLRIAGNLLARYGFPTVELIDWLKTRIGDRTAIEIGSGSGDLCHHMGIPGTDNYQQTWPDVQIYYRLMRQPTISYAPWVEEIDALAAVRKYRPQVVIGSWITHWVNPNLPVPCGGNMFGVREDELLGLVDTYIMIGNLAVHNHKPILIRPHEELQFDFVKSRGSRPDLNRIFVWTKS